MAYAGLILAFLGGALWGLTLARASGTPPWGYAVAVLPSLWPPVCALLGPRLRLVGLAAAFAVLLAYDLWTIRRGSFPAWYARLRWQLTGAAVSLLLLGALA